MQLLKDKILSEGNVKPGNVLKVDSFLNHQLDVKLFREIGKEFARRFADDNVTKILTIEASGIGIACIVAEEFDCKVVFAKKTQSKNLDGEILTSTVHSYTKGIDYDIMVSSRFIEKGDRILIIDDFLANGCAILGLADIIKQAGATLVGAGIVIEKGFQQGGELVKSHGIRLESLAVIEKMDNGRIEFRS